MNKNISSLYSKKVMEHFSSPHNMGKIKNPSGRGRVGNPVCGDLMELQIKVAKRKGEEYIKEAKFQTFGCLPEDEKIVLSNGEWEKISEIKKSNIVVNSEGEKTLVVKTYKRYYSGRLLKIIPFVSPFNSFSLTPEHPVFCIKRKWVKGARHCGSKCDWLRTKKDNLLSTKAAFVEANKIEEGDYLVFNVNKKVSDDSIFTKETMRLLGYYLSEGYITAQESVVAFAFNRKEKTLIKEIEKLLQKITGKKSKIRFRENVAEVYICSRKLVRFLTFHCKKMARNKSVSEEVLSLSFSKQWELIKTYLLGDGDVYRRRAGNSQTYRLTTVSESLAVQMQEMLARGGIFASIRQIFKTNCYIKGRQLKDSIQYLMSFKLQRNHKFVHYNTKYFLIPIKRIKKEDFNGYVYNLQVHNEPNAYLVRGFGVHNCGAAIATSSMLTDMITGKSLKEAQKISNQAIIESLDGLPPIKRHCSVLAEEALRKAIADYQQKK